MSTIKIFMTRKLPEAGIQTLLNTFDVEIWPEYTPPPRDILLQKIKEVDGLVSLLTDKIDKDLLKAATNLKIISQYAVGYDNIDLDACTSRGIYVTNTPGVLTDATADHTMALILAIARRIVESDAFVRTGKWEESKTGWHPTMFLGVELSGKTLGIVGLGRIGAAVARRARAFGMKIVYYSRQRKLDLEKELEAKYMQLDELLKVSDIVSIHVSLNDKTRNLIGARELDLMKPTALLINTSRGAVIDEDALYHALTNGKIAGAALDVFRQEPTPKTNKLLTLKNIVVTPHTGSATYKTRTKMAEIVSENLIAFFSGKIPPTLVNKDVINVRKPEKLI